MDKLKELYYDKSGQYRSQASLFRKQQVLGLGFKRYEIISFIKKQIADELFTRPANNNFFEPKKRNNQWHIDIAQLDNGQQYFAAVDTFTKQQAWRKVAGKDQKSVESAFLSIVEEMGMPQSVFCDQEKSFPYLEKYCKVIINHGGHAPMVERSIRTVKEKIALAKFEGGAGRTDELIDEIVRKYNAEHIYEPTGLTPNEMALPANEKKVAEIYQERAGKNTESDLLAVGDEVRVAQKIQENQKKHTPKWSADVYEIKRIKTGPVVTYEVQIENSAGRKKIESFIRSDLKPAVADSTAVRMLRPYNPAQASQTDKEDEEEITEQKEPPVLKVIKNDVDSTFQPAVITEKRIPKRQEKLNL